jgi:hypothetical protein
VRTTVRYFRRVRYGYLRFFDVYTWLTVPWRLCTIRILSRIVISSIPMQRLQFSVVDTFACMISVIPPTAHVAGWPGGVGRVGGVGEVAGGLRNLPHRLHWNQTKLSVYNIIYMYSLDVISGSHRTPSHRFAVLSLSCCFVYCKVSENTYKDDKSVTVLLRSTYRLQYCITTALLGAYYC